MEPLGHPNRPKIAPSRLLRPLFFKNVDFQKNERRVGHSTILALRGHPRRPKIDPRSLQDGSKMIFKSFFFHLRFCLRFCSVLGPILTSTWPLLGTQRLRSGFSRGLRYDPKRPGATKTASRCPKMPPRHPKTPPRAAQDPQKSPQDPPQTFSETSSSV